MASTLPATYSKGLKSHLLLPALYPVNTIIIPILQRKKPRLREQRKRLIQGHTGRKRQNWDLDLGVMGLKSLVTSCQAGTRSPGAVFPPKSQTQAKWERRCPRMEASHERDVLS